MSEHTKHIEVKVSELRDKGATDFYKQRGTLIGGVDPVCPHSDTTPKLEWDDFTGEDYSPEFIWLLYYFDGKEYSKVIIPPDNVAPEGVVDWYYYAQSWRNPDETAEIVDYKALIEDAIECHSDSVSVPMGEEVRFSLVSARLRSALDVITEMESSLHEPLWEIVYQAFKAGREAEYGSAEDGRDTAMRMKTMHKHQQSKTRSSRLLWTKYAEVLIRKKPSVSARELAMSLKEANICDFSEWREDEITFYDDSKGESQDKSWEAFEVAVSRLKTRFK